MGQLTTTCRRFSGGVTAAAATEKTIRLPVLGTWVEGDTFVVHITDIQEGLVVSIGKGQMVGLEPSFLFTYKRKLNFLAGTKWGFSAIDAPAVFNDLTREGNGLIEVANYYAAPEDVQALAPFQGRVLVVGKNVTVPFNVAADPDAYDDQQTLDNAGTIAPLSVQAWGELEVYSLDETGVRSNRTKETTLNASVIDVGSPVDILIKAKLAECTAEQKAAACGIVDPTSGRYWIFIKDTIYVLSNFPGAGILAWGMFFPSYQSTDYGLALQNTGLLDLVVKVSMVNDAAHAHDEVTLPGNSVEIESIRPGNYLFIYDILGELLHSTAINETDPGSGVAFRGIFTIDGDEPGNVSIGGGPNQTAFVPEKFLTHKKQVFARDANALYAYGGVADSQYDNCVALAQIPWIKVAEGLQVTADGMNANMSGTWYCYGSMDYLSEGFSEVLAAQDSATYDGGKIGFTDVGSHFSFMAVSSDNERAVLSALQLNYQ